MTSRPRDSQRQRVVAALRSVPFEPLDQPMAQDIALRFLSSEWWRINGPGESIIAVYAFDSRNCMAKMLRNPGTAVTIPFTRPTTAIDVIHSLVHLSSAHMTHAPWHGPFFCEQMLSATQAFFDWDTRLEVFHAFMEHGARVTELTPEQKATETELKQQRQQRASVRLESDLRALMARLDYPETAPWRDTEP